MDFSHTLTLIAPYTKLPLKNGFELKITTAKYEEDNEEEEMFPVICNPSEANVFWPQIVVYGEGVFTLAECPDFKTADAFVKIIDSLLQTFQ